MVKNNHIDTRLLKDHFSYATDKHKVDLVKTDENKQKQSIIYKSSGKLVNLTDENEEIAKD